MSEHKYKTIIDDYLSNTFSVTEFIIKFMLAWKDDRDNNVAYDEKFQRLIDSVFTSCDCYNENPQGKFEITENELKQEISLLNHIWFG